MGFSTAFGYESKALSLTNWARERNVGLSLAGNKGKNGRRLHALPNTCVGEGESCCSSSQQAVVYH